MAAPAGQVFKTVATTASPANTTAMVPRSRAASSNRPKPAASLRPASSSKTPATHAATYSPVPWPRTANGSTPQDRQSSDNAYSKANSKGCANEAGGGFAPAAGAASHREPRDSPRMG